MPDRLKPVRIVLEVGRTWTFAAALDWPGWCRRGKGEHGAIETLFDYADRYALVAGSGFSPEEAQIVDRLPGTGSTDFGAPDARSRWDDEPIDTDEALRLTALLEASWQRFDAVVAGAPETLRKGPRGGGRDRDAIADHVRESERNYARMFGPRLPPRTSSPQQRFAIVEALRAGAPAGRWPARYALRRLAWHVLDHAWEIEDKGS